MEPTFSGLDSIDELTKTLEEKSEDSPKESAKDEVISVPVTKNFDVENLKKLMEKEHLFIIKNVGKEDIIVDWDIPLMPEELKSEFDKYLSSKYLAYNLDEKFAKLKVVAIFKDGRTISFLDNFMNEKQIPQFMSTQVGPEMVLKSKCVIPVDRLIICTETQVTSLQKFERKRMASPNGQYSDWYGQLAIRQLSNPDQIDKADGSIVTVSELKTSNLEPKKIPVTPLRGTANFETAEDLIKL